MAVCYIVGSLIVIIINGHALPAAFSSIFICAFKPQAIAGGVIGVTIQKSMARVRNRRGGKLCG